MFLSKKRMKNKEMLQCKLISANEFPLSGGPSIHFKNKWNKKKHVSMDSSLCLSAISKPFAVVAVAVVLYQHTMSSLVSCLDFDKSPLSFYFIWIMFVHRCSHWVGS